MTKTTSYEISKKLKEAGFDKGSAFDHFKSKCGGGGIFYVWEGIKGGYEEEFFSYDLETILDALPKKLANKYGKNGALKLSYDTKLNWIYYADKEDYILFFNDYAFCEIKSQENESLADTAGRMWLLLKEKGIV